MNCFIFCFIIVLVLIKNATPTVYVLDLTNQGTDEDKHIKLNDLLHLFKNSADDSKFRLQAHKIEKHRSITKNYADCLYLDTTKAEKLKCLENISRKDKRSDKTPERSDFFPKYRALFARQPKRKIYSLYNYYGGLLKSTQPFTDLTRQEFSQDYLDIGDLSRSVPKCQSPDCKNLDLHTLNYLTEMLNSGNGENNRRVFENVIQRSYSSDESSDSTNSDSRKDKKKHRKPNRFEVVFNDDSSASEEKRNRKKPFNKSSEESEEYSYKKKKHINKSSEESKEYNYKRKKPIIKSSEESKEYNYKKKKPIMKSSEESEEYKKSKPRKIKIESDDSSLEVTEKPSKSREKYAYLQGNKVYDSFRRRLQHFLPKRFHWDEDDIHHLGYYWFDGPRGKYT